METWLLCFGCWCTYKAISTSKSTRVKKTMVDYLAVSTKYTGTNVHNPVLTNISWCFEQWKELKTREFDSNMRGNRGFV